MIRFGSKGFTVGNEEEVVRMSTERETRVVIMSLDATAAMTRVKIIRGGVELELDNCLGLEVGSNGLVKLSLTNVDYHGPGDTLSVGGTAKPAPLTRHPAPTRDEWLDW